MHIILNILNILNTQVINNTHENNSALLTLIIKEP
jgi:hypothetical protein